MGEKNENYVPDFVMFFHDSRGVNVVDRKVVVTHVEKRYNKYRDSEENALTYTCTLEQNQKKNTLRDKKLVVMQSIEITFNYRSSGGGIKIYYKHTSDATLVTLTHDPRRNLRRPKSISPKKSKPRLRGTAGWRFGELYDSVVEDKFWIAYEHEDLANYDFTREAGFIVVGKPLWEGIG